MRQIKWLQKNVIERRSETVKGAIKVSIEHHQQIADATMLEFFTAVAKGRTSISADHCGLCQHYDKCKNGCCLGSYLSCCEEWRTIRDTISGLFVNRNSKWQDVQKAERKMVRRLKRELNKCQEK